MKRQNKTMVLLAICMAGTCGCSNEHEEENVSNKLVELAVNPSIIQTRATNGEGVQPGTAGDALGSIAVYANSTTTNATANNFAVYTYDTGNSTWGNSNADNKIFLSNENATIYANYPSTKTATHSSTAVNAESVVEVSTLAGATGTAGEDNTITITNNSTSAINACAKEVDYMYATPVGSKNNASSEVSLNMNHAMSMVSFRIYKDKNYTNSAHLTKIELSNVGQNKVLLKPGSNGKATMKLGDGNMTIPSGEAITYTRFTKENSTGYYQLKEPSDNETTPTVPAFSILVYPVTTKIEADKVQVKFEIDGKEYPLNLPTREVSSSYSWAPGKNHVYTINMNGKELSVTTVTLTDWEAETVGDKTDLVK